MSGPSMHLIPGHLDDVVFAGVGGGVLVTYLWHRVVAHATCIYCRIRRRLSHGD